MPDHAFTLGPGHPTPEIPHVPEPYVIRPRVRRVLDAAHRMTVLRAPLGFGKTAAITSWLGDTHQSRALAWHGLRAPPVSSLSFWVALATDLSACLTPGRPPATTYDDVCDLVAALTAPLLIVIDGLEAAESTPTSDPSPVGAIVTEIVDLLRSSPHLQVVISCRPYGPLAMDALFGPDAQILDSAELALSEEDTLELAAAAGVPLTPAQAHHLHSRLWGWPVLTRTVIDRVASSGTGYTETSWEVAGGYLAALDTQRVDPEVGHFIRQVSILDPLTGPLARRLTGSPFAGRALADLERSGLTRSRLHDGERHYTLLPAVVHAIRVRPAAAAEHAPAHRHAAKMFRNLPEHALRHSVLAQDWDLVVSIAEEQTVPLVLDHPRGLLGALAAVPAPELRGHLGLVRLRDVLARFDDDVFDRPTTLPLPGEVLDPPTLRRALTMATAQILALRACHHDVAAADLVTRCAQALLGPGDPLGAGAALPLFLLHAGIARCLVGDLGAAITDFEECLERSSTAMEPLARAAAEYSALAQALCGDLSGARRMLERSRGFSRALVTLELVDDRLDRLVGALIALDELDLEEARRLLPSPDPRRQVGVPPAWFVDEYVRAHLRVLSGDLFSATTGLSRALHDRRTSLGRGTLSSEMLTATAATINVWGGNATRAKNFLGAVPPGELVNAVHADVALQVGDVEGALAIADTALAGETMPDRLRVEMLLTRTVARDRQGHRFGAAADLREAITLADPLLLRPFLAVPRALLEEMVTRVPEASVLLARLESAGITLTLVEHQLMVSLAADEQDLLRALDAGARIDTIARSLGIPATDAVVVVENLFRSLGVHDRLGAIAAGHMLGYLGVPGT
ncbi:LuxR family transcriptional regulator, maltose regulon positive regulatory protein [Sanguibacter gelidistatuariae]|uniref:LuxR family transcriptional regulator, maltose regulon positive regulatory protein n=1 Tax=Sanguibacter gelidistatuariae TaxID=1814289 RepID=A0A1G6H982_9MICO|nr:hypothetical protein [Sanguibacter gelidistatuariae]SDB89996.1 LuxR family transcriptional regulator, maltose regulon positive regulatory protein [Sanguibacter gelidistatuariae]